MADQDVKLNDGSGLKERVKILASGIFQRYVHIANPSDVSGGPATIADGADATQGAKADAAATTDTGTFSLIALVKRGLQTLTSILSRLTGCPNYANGQATAGTTSSQVVAARATRRSVLIRNTDASNTAYVGAGTVTSGNGFPLKAGESVEIGTTAAVNSIRATADVVLAYVEVYD